MLHTGIIRAHEEDFDGMISLFIQLLDSHQSMCSALCVCIYDSNIVSVLRLHEC